MLEAESCNVRVVNQIACRSRLANDSIKHRRVPPRFSEQNERGRGQHSLQIGQRDLRRDGRMKDPGMGDHPEEFVNARPRDGPGQGAFRERFQNLDSGAMMLARLDLSVDQDVGVNRLHRLGPIHKIPQRIPVQQIDPWKFSSLPSPKTQSIRLQRACRQRAAKKVIDDGLESSAFLGSFLFQFKEKLIFNRQSGSPHMQKHMFYASRCQDPRRTERPDRRTEQ